MFDHYQQFIDRRRTRRPAEDCRAPTAAELAEFGEHFGKRRIEMGICVRPYGTPCIHGHACLRCPFQQIDPDQLHQLQQVETDIRTRIDQLMTFLADWLAHDHDRLDESLVHFVDNPGYRITHLEPDLERLF